MVGSSSLFLQVIVEGRAAIAPSGSAVGEAGDVFLLYPDNDLGPGRIRGGTPDHPDVGLCRWRAEDDTARDDRGAPAGLGSAGQAGGVEVGDEHAALPALLGIGRSVLSLGAVPTGGLPRGRRWCWCCGGRRCSWRGGRFLQSGPTLLGHVPTFLAVLT